MTTDGRLEQFYAALAAPAQDAELRNGHAVVQAMLERHTVDLANVSPISANVTMSQVATSTPVRRAGSPHRFGGRKRVAAAVAAFVLCSSTLAAAGGATPTFLDPVLPNFDWLTADDAPATDPVPPSLPFRLVPPDNPAADHRTPTATADDSAATAKIRTKSAVLAR